MLKKFIVIGLVLLVGCTDQSSESPSETTNEPIEIDLPEQVEETEPENLDEEETEEAPNDYQLSRNEVIEKYTDVTPNEWGETVSGVITKIDTEDKIIALTFDACDVSPNAYDEELIQFLIEEDIPATLFLAGQWIQSYEEEFMELSNQPLFEIANHGYHHKPLSVNGESAYSISGTENVEEVVDEVIQNQLLIEELTGISPNYFRSGTAYYDDVSVEIVNELGLEVVNYNVLGDAGGTFNTHQIASTFETAEKGSIFLFHMNQPDGDIASGVREGVMNLKEKGFEFVQLQEYDEYLK